MKRHETERQTEMRLSSFAHLVREEEKDVGVALAPSLMDPPLMRFLTSHEEWVGQVTPFPAMTPAMYLDALAPRLGPAGYGEESPEIPGWGREKEDAEKGREWSSPGVVVAGGDGGGGGGGVVGGNGFTFHAVPSGAARHPPTSVLSSAHMGRGQNTGGVVVGGGDGTAFSATVKSVQACVRKLMEAQHVVWLPDLCQRVRAAVPAWSESWAGVVARIDGRHRAMEEQLVLWCQEEMDVVSVDGRLVLRREEENDATAEMEMEMEEKGKGGKGKNSRDGDLANQYRRLLVDMLREAGAVGIKKTSVMERWAATQEEGVEFDKALYLRVVRQLCTVKGSTWRLKAGHLDHS